MTSPKAATAPTEHKIALTVNDHNAQRVFQSYVAGVAQAFREKQQSRAVDKTIRRSQNSKSS
jgi:hypothetical protein